MSAEDKLRAIKDRLNAELISITVFSKNRGEFEQGEASGLNRAIKIIQDMTEEKANEQSRD